MTSPIGGPGSQNYTANWAEVVYTPKTDTISLPEDTPITTNWADAVTIPGSDGPAAPAKNWSEDYKVVMPDPWIPPAPEPEPAPPPPPPEFPQLAGIDTSNLTDRDYQRIREWPGIVQAWEQELGPDWHSAQNTAQRQVDPIALDLNGDGKIGVTGQTTAKDGKRDALGRTVMFDIDGDGKKDEMEWMSGDGDGLLVDDRDGGATGAMLTTGEIDGRRLFGDEGGKFQNGFSKLKGLDKDGDGKLTGAELDGLKVWVDDGDAKLEGGELKTLRELGITEMSVQMKLEKNEKGEDLERSSFVMNGETRVSEDVWFGAK